MGKDNQAGLREGDGSEDKGCESETRTKSEWVALLKMLNACLAEIHSR